MKSTIPNLRKNNRLADEAVAKFREEFRDGSKSFSDFSNLKHKFPFHGFVKCETDNFSWVMFSAADDLVAMQYHWFGKNGYERETVKLWEDLCAKASCVLDIGGYTGMMSVVAALASNNSKVHYFEPMERIVERAQINFRSNKVNNRIIIHNIAVSDVDEEKTINLYRPENFLGTGSSLTEKPNKDVVTATRVRARCLDPMFTDEKVDVIKLDVEGHELQALRGMMNVLVRDKPQMIIEIWPHEYADVMRVFDGLEYKLERLDGKDGQVSNFYATSR